MKKLIILILFSTTLCAQNTATLSATDPPTLCSGGQPQEIFTIVEEMPEFPGGQKELDKFVQDNFKYPADARKNGITGKCYLKFVVESTGDLCMIQVIKGVPGCPECDKEAVRLIKIMPKWKPGKQNGRAVTCYYHFPISFRLG